MAGAPFDADRSSARSRVMTVAAALLAATFATACAVAPAKAPQRPVARQAAEPANGVREQRVQLASADITLNARLFGPPPAAAGAHRRPAVVMLHGCGGMLDERGALKPLLRGWADRLAGWGYVVLAVDSFGSRGIGSVCEIEERHRPGHPWRVRIGDAYAALDYLASRRDVDRNAIFVVGWSHGGSTATGAVRDDAPGLRAGGPRFRAAIAYYPGCTRPLRQKVYRPAIPLLILHGQDDDWAPAAPCVELAAKLKEQGFDVTTVVYPGARHAFDSLNDRIIYRPDVHNPHMPGGKGTYVGGHRPSREKAIGETGRFLESHRAH